MYNHAIILDCFAGLIGFQQTHNTEHMAIDEDLTESRTGIYVGPSLHPLFTNENLMTVADKFDTINVKSHSVTTTYPKGALVKSGEVIYRSLQDGNLNNDVSDTDFWKETNLLSNFLRNLYNGSVLKLMNSLFVKKKVNEVAKTLVANVSLYDGVGNITGRITNLGRMVGFKINLHHEDITATLTHIGMQVDTVQNPINIYLYHSSSDQPLQTFTLNHTKSVQFQWHKITNEILSFLDENIPQGGSYYLCYNQSELTGEAISKTIGFDGTNRCGSCSEAVANRRLHGKWGKFINIQPFYVNEADLPGDGSLWDEEKEIYVDDSNFGLNLQMSIQCDVSHLFCQSTQVLTDALCKQLTVDLLSEMAFSTRDNQNKFKVAGLAAAALDNQEHGQYGEQKKLDKAIEAASFDFSNLSELCLPCGNNRAGKRKSVWSL